MSANMKSRIGKKQSALKKKTKANGTMKKQFQLPEDINTLRKKQDRAARFQKDTSKKSNSFSLFSEQVNIGFTFSNLVFVLLLVIYFILFFVFLFLCLYVK